VRLAALYILRTIGAYYTKLVHAARNYLIT